MSSFLLLTSLYIFLSLALLVSFFNPWEPWLTPSSSVWMEQLLPSCAASRRARSVGPLCFLYEWYKGHIGTSVSQIIIIPNAQELSAYVLQFLVASWWLLKQIPVRSDGQHMGSLRRHHLILISYRSHGLIPFSHPYLAQAFLHHPLHCHVPCQQHVSFSYQQVFFLFYKPVPFVYFTSSPLLVFTIF